MANCRGCTNNCRLTINKFSGGRQFVSGNRCERGIGKEKNKEHIPNLYEYKYKRIFSYEPLSADKAVRGKVGIPRVLNMFENYPFWFTFFTKLNYEVVLSPTSTRKIYELGIESIPSESECYPAKWLTDMSAGFLKKGIKFIFYPCIPYERNEFPDAVNHYNCPIVTSYAENIKNNVDELHNPEIDFRNPFLAFTSEAVLTDRLVEVFKELPAQGGKRRCSRCLGRTGSSPQRILRKRRRRNSGIPEKKQGAGALSWQDVPITLTRKSITASRILLTATDLLFSQRIPFPIWQTLSVRSASMTSGCIIPALCCRKLCKNKGGS